MYQARILDKNRRLKAILPGIRWHYVRRINEATAIEIYIPRETVDEHVPQGHALYGFFAPSQPFAVQSKTQMTKQNKTQYAEIAAFIQIYKGDQLKASGKITGRNLGEIVTVEALTEEILLESNLTPAQYGKVWDGWDYADVARDLLDGWRTVRVKDISQWQDRIVTSSNVDLTTDPGKIMLRKRSNGRYYDSGHLTLLFNKSEFPNFKSWDRVRWSADSEEPVKTSIQVSTNRTSFSTAFDGGFPEEVGYYIGGDHDQVWIRINLSTTDTESEDENGNKVGVTPTVFAVELIARTEGNLVAGNIPSVAGVTVKGLSADHATAFNVLKQACEQVGWEFNVWDGSLNLAEALGVDRTKDFVLRAGTNIEIQTLGDSDGDLVNILTAYGPGRGINRMEITLRDEASIAQFGEYPQAMEFDAEKLDELEQKAQEFLSEHNLPKTQFEVAVAFDHDKEPDYGLGDKVRVADPETGIVTTTRIMAESREYGENGLVVNLELGKADFTLAEAISGKRKPNKPLDPLQPTGVYARGVIAGLVVGCAVPKIDWAYTECHLSTASGFTPSSNTLRTSGRQSRFDIMELTPGVRYYAKLIHVDSAGRRSEPSQEVSVVASAIVDVPIEVGHIDGTVTRFDALGAFLRDADDIDSVYASRMVMGKASDGQTISLNWTHPPKVIVAPQSMLTYVESAKDGNQIVESWVDNISPDGFTVHCHIVGDGFSHGENLSEVIGYEESWVSPYTLDEATYVQVHLGFSGSYWWINPNSGNPPTGGLYSFTYKLSYQKQGSSSWINFGSFTEEKGFSGRGSGSWGSTRAHTIVFPEPGVYRVRVTHTDSQFVVDGWPVGGVSNMKFSSWESTGRDIIAQGDVIYFAIEGGAVNEG